MLKSLLPWSKTPRRPEKIWGILRLRIAITSDRAECLINLYEPTFYSKNVVKKLQTPPDLRPYNNYKTGL